MRKEVEMSIISDFTVVLITVRDHCRMDSERVTESLQSPCEEETDGLVLTARPAQE